MGWTQAGRTVFVRKVPGALALTARTETHSESISVRISVNRVTVRNWCVLRSEKSADAVQAEVDGMLTELADGIRGVRHEEGEA